MEHPMIKLLEIQQKEIAELNIRIATPPTNKDSWWKGEQKHTDKDSWWKNK